MKCMLAGLLFEMETSYFTMTWDQWVVFHASHASGSSICPRVKSSHVSVGMIPGLREHALSPKPQCFKQPCQPESCDWKPHSAQGSLPPEPVSHAMALTSCPVPVHVSLSGTQWAPCLPLPPVFSSLPAVALQDSGCTTGYVDWENTKQLPLTSSIIRQQRAVIFALGVKICKGDSQICRNS